MTSQATVLKPDTQSQIQETKNKESDNIIKNFSNFSILSSFALYAQASYWKSMRRHSGQFCFDFLGVSYLEDNHLIKIYLENFAEPYSEKEAKVNLMFNRSSGRLDAKSKIEVGLTSRDMNFIFGLLQQLDDESTFYGQCDNKMNLMVKYDRVISGFMKFGFGCHYNLMNERQGLCGGAGGKVGQSGVVPFFFDLMVGI